MPIRNEVEDFEFSAYTGNISSVKNYLNRDSDSSSKLKETSSALGWAVVEGQQEIVKYLLENGFDPNMKVNNLKEDGFRQYNKLNNGDLPLVSSACLGFLDVVNLFIIHGANVDLQNDNGSTALTQAVQKGHEDIATIIKNYIFDQESCM